MLSTQRSLHFRPGKRAALPLPVAVRSVGHYQLGLDFQPEKSMKKHFYQLFWTVQGEGEAILHGRNEPIQSEQVFLYRPGDRHDLRRSSEVWDYWWLTLDAPASAPFFSQMPERGASWFAGRCPIEAFEALTDAVDDPTPAGERRASIHAYRILVAAWFGALDPDPEHPLAARARAWLQAHYREPTTTVEGLAVACGMHRATIFRAFEAAFGLSPAEYLRNLRLQDGLRRLKETNQPIQAITHACGFSDPNYFARAIRQVTGLSPREFRRSGAG